MRHSARAVYDKPNDGGGAPPVVVTPETPPVVPPVVVAASPVVPETQVATVPKKDWKDDRIAKLTHDLNEVRRAKAAAVVQPVTPQTPGETDAAFAARVDEAANAKAGMIAAQADWNRQCDTVAELGRKEFPDFDARITAITKTLNPQDQGEIQAYNEVIAAAIETGEAHKVLYALGSDPGEYQRIMKLSPVKRAMELGKMAVALVSDKEPSGMPAPIVPISGRGEHYEGIAPDDPKRAGKLPTKEWMKLREAQARERGIQ